MHSFVGLFVFGQDTVDPESRIPRNLKYASGRRLPMHPERRKAVLESFTDEI